MSQKQVKWTTTRYILRCHPFGEIFSQGGHSRRIIILLCDPEPKEPVRGNAIAFSSEIVLECHSPRIMPNASDGPLLVLHSQVCIPTKRRHDEDSSGKIVLLLLSPRLYPQKTVTVTNSFFEGIFPSSFRSFFSSQGQRTFDCRTYLPAAI